MQAVEIVVAETMSALLTSRPSVLEGIIASARRHASRSIRSSDDAAFALELDRQMTRLLRNIALLLSTDALATERSEWRPR